MVQASFITGKRLRYTGFTLSGHSGFASRGEDIVCAGISSLALTIAMSLERYLAKKVSAVQAPSGMLEVRILEEACEEEEFLRAETLMVTLKLGLDQICRQYPGTIEISESEVFSR